MKAHDEVIAHESPTQKNFSSIDHYVDFIRASDYEGVSFSGGEPFLYLTDMIYCIKKLKKLPQNLYIWAYTCGDLITEEIVKSLKDAGLNELRLNIVSRGYDCSPILIMTKYLENVAIEIPAIPGDQKIVENLIPNLIKQGVKFLNLHELAINTHNRTKVLDKGFKGDTVVEGSEKAALEILNFVEQNHFPLTVNFCSNNYKKNRAFV